MGKLSQTLRRPCSACWLAWGKGPALSSSRLFSTSRLLAEDTHPRPTSTRAQAQRESAEAIQNLARSRETRQDGRHGQAPVRTGQLNQQIFRKPSHERGGQPVRRIVSGGGGVAQIPRPSTSSPRSPGSSPPQRNSSSPRPFAPRSGGGVPRRGSGAVSRRSSGPRRRVSRFDNEFDEDDDEGNVEEDEDGDEMTEEEELEELKKLGYVEPPTLRIAQGPHIDMAAMMKEYAPKHFGVTEPSSGAYPKLADQKRRGLLHDIVKQARKNETYTEKDIDQLVKKLGPMMPRA